MTDAMDVRKRDEFKQRGLALAVQAEEFVIAGPASFEEAARFRAGILDYIQQIEAHWAPAIKAAYEAHKTVLRQRDDWLVDYRQAARSISDALAAFESAAQAEQARLRREHERAAQAAVKAAEAVAGRPVPVLVAPAPTVVPKADGLGFRDQWFAMVTDLKGLVRAVADGKQPLALLEPNMTALNGLARTLKNEMAVPGVEARKGRVAVSQQTSTWLPPSG